MKKLRLVSLIIVFGLFFTCSKNSTDAEDNETGIVVKVGNLQGTGESANDILSNTNFDKILIEIAYVTGFKPSEGAMDDFVLYLKEHSFKENIELSYKELSSPDKETLTLEDIDELEQENRTAYNDGTTLSFYIYFADAPSDEDVEEEDLVTLGAVYRNTSMVIYEKTIINLASTSFSITAEDIETPTINHEFGHLFGLVNLGFEEDLLNPLKTNMINPHEDSEAASHCTTIGCLMRAELQFYASNKSSKVSENGLHSGCTLTAASVLQMLQNKNNKGFGSAPGLGADCILDLKANGGR